MVYNHGDYDLTVTFSDGTVVKAPANAFAIERRYPILREWAATPLLAAYCSDFAISANHCDGAVNRLSGDPIRR